VFTFVCVCVLSQPTLCPLDTDVMQHGSGGGDWDGGGYDGKNSGSGFVSLKCDAILMLACITQLEVCVCVCVCVCNWPVALSLLLQDGGGGDYGGGGDDNKGGTLREMYTTTMKSSCICITFEYVPVCFRWRQWRRGRRWRW
jgi:hypothetical protein